MNAHWTRCGFGSLPRFAADSHAPLGRGKGSADDLEGCFERPYFFGFSPCRPRINGVGICPSGIGNAGGTDVGMGAEIKARFSNVGLKPV